MSPISPFTDPRFWVVMGVVMGYMALTRILSVVFLWELENPVSTFLAGLAALTVFVIIMMTCDGRQNFIRFIALVPFFAAGSLIDRAAFIVFDPSIRGWVDRWFPPKSTRTDKPFKSSAGEVTQPLNK